MVNKQLKIMKKFKYLVCCILSFFFRYCLPSWLFSSIFGYLIYDTKAIDTKAFSRLFTVYWVIVVPFAIFALNLITNRTNRVNFGHRATSGRIHFSGFFVKIGTSVAQEQRKTVR